MNRSHKASLLTSTLCTTLLVSGIVHANAEVKLVNASLNAFYDYQQLLSNSQVNGSQLLAAKRKEHTLAQSNLLSSAKPTENITHSNCSNRKKNHLYELSAIFNDKLHLFLASFNQRSTFTAAKSRQTDNPIDDHDFKS
ncbi:hypothetical protein [Thalassotalea sp. G2M2-11]|uniref:hypothetical protein n=1 Tax=Thalassotalea sp. G2M2-11 TaxID=2787627 RepID=UPI0019D314A7|nr:hypothetical protein [Thalassotalea sp. G2M2-11]